MQACSQSRAVILAAALLFPSAAWPGLSAPLRVTQNIAGSGSFVASAGLRPGGSVTVRGDGPPDVEVKITFVDAGGPVELRQRGTFVVTFPVSGQPKSSAVFFRMDNRSRQNVLYTLTAN